MRSILKKYQIISLLFRLHRQQPFPFIKLECTIGLASINSRSLYTTELPKVTIVLPTAAELKEELDLQVTRDTQFVKPSYKHSFIDFAPYVLELDEMTEKLSNLKYGNNSTKPSEEQQSEPTELIARVTLLGRLLRAFIGQYLSLSQIATYSCTSSLLADCILNTFLSLHETKYNHSVSAIDASLNTILNLEEVLRSNDVNLKLYCLTLQMVYYEEFFNLNPEYAPLLEKFLIERVYKKTYTVSILQPSYLKVGFGSIPHQKLWEADTVTKSYLHNRPVIVEDYKKRILPYIKKEINKFLNSKPSIEVVESVGIATVASILSLSSKVSITSKNFSVILEADLNIHEFLVFVCICAANIKSGQDKYTTEEISGKNLPTIKATQLLESRSLSVEELSKARSYYLHPAWSSLGQAILTSLFKNLHDKKLLADDLYYKYLLCMDKPEDVAFHQIFITLGLAIWNQVGCTEEEYSQHLSDKSPQTHSVLYTKKSQNSHFFDFELLSGLVRDERHWQSLVTQSTVQYPSSYQQKNKLIPSTAGSKNRMINSEVLLDKLPSGITLNLDLINQFFNTLVSKSDSFIKFGDIVSLFTHPKTRKTHNNTPDIVTETDLHKFITFTLYIRFMANIHPGAVSTSGKCISLFSSKYMDWRGRLYSPISASVTSSPLYRIFVTSGEGLVNVNIMRAVIVRMLDEYARFYKFSSINQITSDFKKGKIKLPTTEQVIATDLLKDYRLLWTYSYYLYCYNLVVKDPSVNLSVSIELDHLSSGPQIVSALLGNKKAAIATNAWINNPSIFTEESFLSFAPVDIYTDLGDTIRVEYPNLWQLLGGNLERSLFKNYLMFKLYGKSDLMLVREDVGEALKITLNKLLKSESMIKIKDPKKQKDLWKDFIIQTYKQIILAKEPVWDSDTIRDIYESNFNKVISNNSKKIINSKKMSNSKKIAMLFKKWELNNKDEKSTNRLAEQCLNTTALMLQRAINEVFLKHEKFEVFDTYLWIITILQHNQMGDGSISWKYNIENTDVTINMKYHLTETLRFDKKSNMLLDEELKKKSKIRTTISLSRVLPNIDDRRQVRGIAANFTHHVDSMILHKVYYKWGWGVYLRPQQRQKLWMDLESKIYDESKTGFLSSVHDCYIVHPKDINKIIECIRSSFSSVISTVSLYLLDVFTHLEKDLNCALSLAKNPKGNIYENIPFEHFTILCSNGVIVGNIEKRATRWNIKFSDDLIYGSSWLTNTKVNNAIEGDELLLESRRKILEFTDEVFNTCFNRLRIYRNCKKNARSRMAVARDLEKIKKYQELQKNRELLFKNKNIDYGWLVFLK